MPYVYSLAGAVTHESGTFLRPLVMDFPGTWPRAAWPISSCSAPRSS